MTSSFRKWTVYKTLYNQNYYGNVICNGLAQDNAKIYRRDILKVATLERTKPSTRKSN